VRKYPVLTAFLLISLGAAGQSYQFFNYGLADGLADKFTYTINQDSKGFLWVGTGNGLCRFDGQEFSQDFKGDSIPANIVFSSFRDSRGWLWFGHENGAVSVLRDGAFTVIGNIEGTGSPVRAILEDGEGNILVLIQQHGLMVIRPDLQYTYFGDDPSDETNPFAGKFLNDFQFTADGHLLVATSDGITLFRYDQELDNYINTGDIEDLRYLLVQEIVGAAREDEFWVGTEDEGLYVIRGRGYDPAGYSVEKIAEDMGLGFARITSIVFNGSRRVWVTDYGTGIHRIELDEQGKPSGSVLFDVDKGIPDQYINDIFVDEEGNQWLSSQGNGIAVLRDQAFTFFNVWEEDQFPGVSSCVTAEGAQWFGGLGRISYSSADQVGYTTYGTGNGLPNDQVTALYADSRGNLYIGTESSGLYTKPAGSSRIRPYYVSGNSLENIINAIDGKGDSIYVATNNGIYILHPPSGTRTGYSTSNGLPHNKVNDILVEKDGTAWIATITPGLVRIRPGEEPDQLIIGGRPKLEFTTLALDGDGVIWAGTYGDGIFRFSSDSIAQFTEQEGLLNNYTYAIGIDPRGHVWIGHRRGLSMYHHDRHTIRALGEESGFTADVERNSVDLTGDGRLLFGTTEGVIRYDAFQAREDTIPPRLSITSVMISDVPYDPSEKIVLKYGKYKVRIDFVGINLSNPEQVTYQYKLEGFEEEWSDEAPVAYANYGRIEDGEYRFLIRACDGNNNCTAEPLSLEITVKIPIWKAWWFILSVALLVVMVIYTVFKIRERNQKAIQEYLQRQLDERTREVIQQKEEIEVKNRDITDSINYAQRIQASILPSIQKLHDAFTGSFVFYQPRDIVSGDFYWYEQVDQDRFIVVCADSTGHGVPGAFMSMIGTTLIKDICLRSGVTSPSEVLRTLDREVRESLNQNREASGSNDGMDIIVAEINMRTLKFTVSSAMRPVILYKGNEQIYVKGNRSSIGGALDEDRTEKEFLDQEFQLSKGDIVYMFSDGYPDQFGGPLGRKFKMVRLKNLLRDIHDKPMEEQYNYIKSNFFLWKEDLEQVDDVLFMGIKI